MTQEEQQFLLSKLEMLRDMHDKMDGLLDGHENDLRFRFGRKMENYLVRMENLIAVMEDKVQKC